MGLVNRRVAMARAGILATLLMLGVLTFPAVASANPPDLESPVETADTVDPTVIPGDPELTPPPVVDPAPSNRPPVTKPPAIKPPVVKPPAVKPPVAPAPAVPVPSEPVNEAPEQAVVPAEDVPAESDAEITDPAATIPPTSATPSATPSATATATTSATATADPSAFQTEDPAALTPASENSSNPPFMQLLVIALLLVLGLLYMRFMRRGTRSLTPGVAKPAADGGK